MEYYEGNYFRYWQYFAYNHQEELFDVVMAMMKDRIYELVPKLVSKYMENFSLDIKTTLNGKSVSMDGIKREISKEIIKSLSKG